MSKYFNYYGKGDSKQVRIKVNKLNIWGEN